MQQKKTHRLWLGVRERLNLVDGAFELLGDAADALLVSEHAAGTLALSIGQDAANSVGVCPAARTCILGKGGHGDRTKE